MSLGETYQDSDAVLGKAGRMYFIVPWRGMTLVGTKHLPCPKQADNSNSDIHLSDAEALISTIASPYPRLGIRCENIRHVFHGRLPATDHMDRVLSRWTYCALAVSETVADYCAESRSIPRDKVRVLTNAVPAPEPHNETTLKRWRDELAIPQDARLVGSLTRFAPEKGTRYLIQAWPELLRREPRAILLLFGDGDEGPDLQRLAADLGVAGQVHFLGFQPDAPRYLGALDCFVLASISEGLSFAVVEALASGLPIVVTAIGGMAELLSDGEDGLLVPAGDPGALADGLSRVLASDELANRLRDGALRTSRRVSLERHVDALLNFYHEALA